MKRKPKTHWMRVDSVNDVPICGAESWATAMVGAADLREVNRAHLAEVTCSKCVKKLVSWGFGIQNFREFNQVA